MIERSIILSENGIISLRSLPHELQIEATEEENNQNLAKVEKKHILATLDYHRGNRQKTAEALGVSRKTLYRKLLFYSEGVS